MLDAVAAPAGILPAQDVILHERGVGSHSLGPVNGSPSNRNQRLHLSFPANAEDFSALQASYDSEVLEIDGSDPFPIFSPRTMDWLLEPVAPQAFQRSLQSSGMSLIS